MSGDREVDLDALFDRDADARLLERRRREELGLTPLAAPAQATPVRFGAESMVDETTPAAPRRPLLRLVLEARPNRDLIPGALATLVASVSDDGGAEARDVLLRIALPPEAEPVAGSFARDEVTLDGEALLGEGLRLGTISPGATVRIRFAVHVLPGTDPLDVLAHASAPGVPAIAAPALRLTRRSGHAAFETPRPFYELEANEPHEPVATPPPPPAPPPPRMVDTVIDEPVVLLPPEPEQPLVVEPPVVVEQPAVVAPPEPRYVLARALDVDEVRGLERTFSGAIPHGLAALALLSSVAAVDSPLGAALGVREVARSIAAALPRALVTARMGRPAPPVVTAEALAAIRADAPADADAAPPGGPMLVAQLDTGEFDALRAVLGRNLADPFLRGVQVLLAVAPRGLDGVSAAAAARVRDALAAYRVAAGAWLMRVTVRRAVDRRYDPLTTDDAALHAAGRDLVAALREAVAP